MLTQERIIRQQCAHSIIKAIRSTKNSLNFSTADQLCKPKISGVYQSTENLSIPTNYRVVVEVFPQIFTEFNGKPVHNIDEFDLNKIETIIIND